MKMRNMRALTIVGGLILILACELPAKPTSAPPPISTSSLSAVLVGMEGRVEVAQPVGADYVRALLGMQLYGGDGVKTYVQSIADIFCQNGNVLHMDAEREEVITCQSDLSLSRQLYEPLVRTHGDQSSLVLPPRESPADYGNVPVVLSPRNTGLLNPNPTFRWMAVGGATRYAVVVKSPSGEVWRGETEQIELAYPPQAPALTSGTTYMLSVEAYLEAETEPRKSTEAIYFSLLSPSEIEEIRALEEELSASPLLESSRRFILAGLYAERGLYHAAITTYGALAGSDEQAIYRHALGGLYVQIKLYQSAVEHYTRAVALAIAHDDKMTQAGAEAGLGRAYYGYGNTGEALTHLEASLRLYEELGKTEQAAWVSGLIVNVQGK